MPHPAADLPFAHRLPTDVALRLALAGGMAAALPSGDAQAMITHDCVHDPNWESVDHVSDAADCW